MANYPPYNYPDIGNAGEDLVAQWLQSQGWVILYRRWRCRWGEIDIIAQHDGVEQEDKGRSQRRAGVSPVETTGVGRQGEGGNVFDGFSASSQTASTQSLDYETIFHRQEMPALSKRLNARELTILQQLSQSEIMQDTTKDRSWLSVEQVLRQYAQYHFGHPIRSATLIDSYFNANHDASL